MDEKSLTDPSATSSPGNLERQTAQTREELGRTVEEISRRLDPKVQAQQRAAAVKEGVAKHPAVVAGAGAAVAAGVASLMVIRRRRR